MNRVVLVHGAFNELWGPLELSARWVPALRDGLWHHGVDIDPAEVAVCFYGDLFRRDPESLSDGQWEASRAGAAEMLADFGGEGMVHALEQAANEASWQRTVDLVAVLTADPGVRGRARDRLVQLIDGSTVAVVAHSLGTVLSYGVLRDHPDLSVHTLVTLGSPLGSEMAAPLIGAAGDGEAPWPGSVQEWVNVAALGDRATGDGVLAGRFGARVRDHKVDNGHRPHAPEPYLNAAVTGAAVAAALRSR